MITQLTSGIDQRLLLDHLEIPALTYLHWMIPLARDWHEQKYGGRNGNVRLIVSHWLAEHYHVEFTHRSNPSPNVGSYQWLLRFRDETQMVEWILRYGVPKWGPWIRPDQTNKSTA